MKRTLKSLALSLAWILVLAAPALANMPKRY
jgi:hypothetical protein